MSNVAAWIRGPKEDLKIEEAEYYQVHGDEILIEVSSPLHFRALKET